MIDIATPTTKNLKFNIVFQAEGYEVIACISVNDAYVMSAWGKEVDPEGKVRNLSLSSELGQVCGKLK